jgi:hypothetical protein
MNNPFINKDQSMNWKRTSLVAVGLLFLTWKLFGSGTTVEVQYKDDAGQPISGIVARFERMNRPVFISIWQEGGSTIAETLRVTTDSQGKASGSFLTFISKGDFQYRGWDSHPQSQLYWGGFDGDRNIEYISGTEKISHWAEKATLRRKIAPHPMIGGMGKSIPGDVKIKDNAIALFDVMDYDWLPPYGKGKYADIEISYNYHDEKGGAILASQIEYLLALPAAKTKEAFLGPAKIICQVNFRFLGEGNGMALGPHKRFPQRSPGEINQYLNQEAPADEYQSLFTAEHVMKRSSRGWGDDMTWGYLDKYFRPASVKNEDNLYYMKIRCKVSPDGKDLSRYGTVAGYPLQNYASFDLCYAVNEQAGLRNIECSEWKVDFSKKK